MNALDGLAYIRKLIINNCELKKPPQLNLLRGNLRYSFVDHNSIPGFSMDYFRGFRDLEHFVASNNFLTAIPSVNELASHLRFLDLNFNTITEVSGEWRENDTVYDLLLKFGLRGNNIASVDTGFVKTLPIIMYLDLKQNTITHFEHPTLHLTGRLWKYTFALSQNPLDCGSHLAWVVFVGQVVKDATRETPVCVYSGNTWLCVHWQLNTREWCN